MTAATRMAIESSLPALASGFSRKLSQVCSFSSNSQLRNSISRNMPPNAAMIGCASVSSVSYDGLPSGKYAAPSAGGFMARRNASTGGRPAAAHTMTSGSSNRMPNTAMTMPMVRKIFCQKSLMRSSTVALMTALSNESDTSRIPRITHRIRACQPP
jgi:hypothetical protein